MAEDDEKDLPTWVDYFAAVFSWMQADCVDIRPWGGLVVRRFVVSSKAVISLMFQDV